MDRNFDFMRSQTQQGRMPSLSEDYALSYGDEEVAAAQEELLRTTRELERARARCSSGASSEGGRSERSETFIDHFEDDDGFSSGEEERARERTRARARARRVRSGSVGGGGETGATGRGNVRSVAGVGSSRESASVRRRAAASRRDSLGGTVARRGGSRRASAL